MGTIGIPRSRHVGFWDPDHPSRYVDETWDPEERWTVIDYLRSPFFRREAYMGSSHCRMGCWGGRMHDEMGCADFSDGAWTWPQGYAHYVEKHGVKPPPDFLAHVRRNLRRIDAGAVVP